MIFIIGDHSNVPQGSRRVPYTYPQIKGSQNMYENEKMYKAGSTFNGKTIEVNNSQKQRQIVHIFLCKAIFSGQ